MSLKITLSDRLLAMFNRGALDKKFENINNQLGLFLLGRHRNNLNSKSAPLRKGFQKWSGAGNSRTSKYKPYVKFYRDFKKEGGRNKWHVLNGRLFFDAISLAKIHAKRDSVTVIVNKGASADYAAVQQYGKPKSYGRKTAFGHIEIPKRPYYEIDDSDIYGTNKIADWYHNRLTQAFGKEARWGHI